MCWEVTFGQLFQCPHEDRPSDCFVLSLPLSASAEHSNLLQSIVILGHNGKCFSVHGVITWLDFAYSFQMLNMVYLIESAHNLAFDVADHSAILLSAVSAVQPVLAPA